MITTDFSQAAALDTGPLSWVMAEIREALGRSKTALFQAGGLSLEERATALQHAKTYLHQAHGALQMVDIDGVGLMTQVAEQALERFKDGTLECNVAHAQAVAELYQALLEYLDELLAGAPSQPVRLFPYYRALQEILGAPRIHPADLFFPDLTDPVRLGAGPKPTRADYPAWRQQFEKALLPFLKSTEPAAQLVHANALLGAVALVAGAQPEGPARTFWCAMHSFAELVASGELACGLYVKQLFGLINLEMRRLAQGSSTLSESMLRDALFFVAAAENPSLRALELRRAYRLDKLVPPQFEIKRYGQLDLGALERAKQAMAQAKAGWTRLSGAEPDALREAAFCAALAQVAHEAGALKVLPMASFLRQLGEIANALESARTPGFDLEMATALLFAEHGLAQIRRLPDDFAANGATFMARLRALAAGAPAPAPSQWQRDLARQIAQEQSVSALAVEMKAGLRQVEKVLDEYYADPSKRPSLFQIDPLLHQLHGALAVLDQDHALRAALQVKDAVLRLARAEDDAASEPKALDAIAQNVGALGFFVDMLAHNVDAAKQRFEFDPAQGTFRAIPFEKIAAAEQVPLLEETLQPEPVVPVQLPVGSDTAIEAELLDIFICEAQEVLAFVRATLEQPRALCASVEQLTTVRRSFHTLKGSGRMVGLAQFGDAAASIERTMNAWLSDEREATADLFDLLELATRELSAWVAELVADGVSGRSADALAGAAQRVQDGAPFTLDAADVADAFEAPIESNDEIVALPLPSYDNVIEFPTVVAPAPAHDDNLKHVGALAISVPLYNIYLAETDQLVRLLSQDFSEWWHEPQRPASVEALHAAHTLAGTSGTVGFEALQHLAHALETALEAQVVPVSALSPAQHEVLMAAIARIKLMLQGFALGDLSADVPELIAALQQLRPQASLPGPQLPVPPQVAEPVFVIEPEPVVAELAPPLPAAAAAVSVPETASREASWAVPASKRSGVDAVFASAITQAPLPVSAMAPGPGAAQNKVQDQSLELVSAATAFTDELDPDLLPIFLEEGADLLPQIGQALRTWQANPADRSQAQMLLRVLHTVKGSARMAGAMRLGQHAHEIETHIENMVHAGVATTQAIEELLANYDHAQLLFDQLRDPAKALANVQAGAVPVPEEAVPAAVAKVPLVRVRADILDRLVNQAGEVSISRSKLESEVHTLRSALSDFSENLARLRRQLREVEMQAESQIASRMAISSEREFDPLEFDRFTRLQELTRMMAESVNDVGSLHENLTRSVDQASTDLVQQARLTRDLQRDLMLVRMVPFASIAERLFRVARQSAKEVGKRVNLDIRGSAVEVDRSVLERMVAPFEHLLRNAIVHGIESRANRAGVGKNETGELLVQVSQQGNEVVLEFSDDGAGLDMPRIGAKARSSGLIGLHDKVTDAQAAEFIFAPGFSTADKLTELAGRGIGMDIVRSEAQALGGRVAVVSRAGKGVRFTIHLPLTLAVTQVVLLTCGGTTYALPSTLVGQVQQMKEAAMAQASADGFVQWQGQQVPLHYLSNLLGNAEVRPPVQRSCPVLMLKSGNERLAVQVDEVLGNREVVIKNIGPQLARMAGISGATVLGSGNIVLILNPVAMLQRLEHQLALRPHLPEPVLESAGARRADQIIMVVDDSMTVRRVTQRLLEREGYQVLLAKDGVDALVQMQAVTPSLMLVDIEMPRMDGFDLTRNVRGDSRTHAIPIIMITSRTADKHRNYALELGVNAYFGKPFQEPVLLAAITGLLSQAVAQPAI